MKKSHDNGHRGARKTLAFLPYHSLVYAKYLNQIGQNTETVRNQERYRIQQAHFQLVLYPHTYAGKTAEDLLESYLRRIEERIEEILRQHHILYWFHLYRRLAPCNTFQDDQITTVGLYRKTLEMAFLKYGRKSWGSDMTLGKDAKPDEIMSGIPYREHNIKPSPQELYVTKFDLEDFVQLLNVEALAHEFYHCTALLRRLYKGGELCIESPSVFTIIHDQETEHLIEKYDTRLPKAGYATMVGVASDFPSFDSKGPPVFIPRYNILLIEYDRLIINRTKVAPLDGRPKYVPNFNLIPFDMRTFYVDHKAIALQIEQVLGFSYEALMQLLTSLLFRLYLLMKDNPRIEYGIMQQGYGAVRDFSFFINDVYRGLGVARRVLGSEARVSLKEIKRVVNYLTYTDADYENLSLWTRGPERLFIPFQRSRCWVNYESFNSILYSMFHGLGIVEDFKGPVLERFLRKRLSKIPGVRQWKFRKRLIYSDTEKREVDYSFIFKDILFICECRAVNKSVDFERGKGKALEFRKKKLRGAIEQVDGLADWLSSHKSGRNYQIPDSVNMICPIVISPFVEYLWSQDSELWLTDDIPRILTPEEMQRFLERGHIKQLYRRPCVEYVL